LKDYAHELLLEVNSNFKPFEFISKYFEDEGTEKKIDFRSVVSEIKKLQDLIAEVDKYFKETIIEAAYSLKVKELIEDYFPKIKVLKDKL
jgi:hypothetical protein